MFFSKFVPEKHLKNNFIGAENCSDKITSFISERPVTPNTVYKNKNIATGEESYYKFSLKKNGGGKFVLDCDKYRNTVRVVKYIPRGAPRGRCYICRRERLLHSEKHIGHSYSEPKKEILKIRNILVPNFLRRDEIEFSNLKKSDRIFFVESPDSIEEEENIEIEFLYADDNIKIYRRRVGAYPCYHFVEITATENTNLFYETRNEIQEWSIFDMSKYFLERDIMIPEHFYKYIRDEGLTQRSLIDLGIPHKSFIGGVDPEWYKEGRKERMRRKFGRQGIYNRENKRGSEGETFCSPAGSPAGSDGEKNILAEKEVTDVFGFKNNETTTFENIILVLIGAIVFLCYFIAVVLKSL